MPASERRVADATVRVHVDCRAAIAPRMGEIAGGLSTIFGRSAAIPRRSGAIIRRTLTIARCLDRPLLSSHGPKRLGLLLPRLSGGVPLLGSLVARRCHLSTLVRRDISRHSGSPTSARLLISKMRRMLTMHTGQVTSPLISALGGFLVACGLILV